MTRREEIEQQAEMFRQPYRGSGNYSTSMDIKNAFQEGAEWADKTMMTHEGEFEEFKELVKRMREAQADYEIIDMAYEYAKYHRCANRELILQRAEAMAKAIKLEDEVDEYLKIEI